MYFLIKSKIKCTKSAFFENVFIFMLDSKVFCDILLWCLKIGHFEKDGKDIMKKRRSFLKVLAASAILGTFALASCGETEIDKLPTPTSENEINAIVITVPGNVDTIKVGQTLQLTADSSVTWSSADTNIATINEAGLLTAVAEGNVKITATSTINPQVTKTKTFIIEKADVVEVAPTAIEITANKTTCKVGEKIELTADVTPAEASQSVVWSSSDESIATVKSGTVTAKKVGKVTITATSKNYESISKTIELTIDKADEVVSEIKWDEIDYTTHDNYLNCEKGSVLKVKGIVTHVAETTTKNGDSVYNYYIQNGTDGYYIYNQAISLGTVEKGKVYEVGGLKKYANGQNELIDVSLFKELNENISATKQNIVGQETNNEEKTIKYQGALVTGEAVIEDITISDSKAYSFTAKIGEYTTSFRVDPTLAGNEFAKINQKLASALPGQTFSFEGFFSHFGYGKTHAPQVQLVNADDITLTALSNEDKLEILSARLGVVPSVASNINTISLEKEITGFEDVTISWASDSDLINVTTGAVNHGDTSKKVKLTATLSLGTSTKDVELEVYVFAKDSKVYNTTVAALDFEDAKAATSSSYGVSPSKSGYADGNVTLGGHTWLLAQTLIASDGLCDGKMGGRVKVGTDAEGRIELQNEYLDFDAIEFNAGFYNSNSKEAYVHVEYQLEGSNEWIKVEASVAVTATLDTYHFVLPAGAKRVAIVVERGKTATVNVDSIKLLK